MAKANSTAVAAALTPKQIVRTVDKLAALKAQIAADAAAARAFRPA